MTSQEKLLSLLNSKDYISKIKLYCKDCKIENLVQKVDKEKKQHSKRIKIMKYEDKDSE